MKLEKELRIEDGGLACNQNNQGDQGGQGNSLSDLDFNSKKRIVKAFFRVGAYSFFGKCKNCGSKNIELFEKVYRGFTYLRCCDCKNEWLLEDDDVFNDKNVIEKIIGIIECFIKDLNEKDAYKMLNLDYKIVECFYEAIRHAIVLHVDNSNYTDVIKKNNLNSIKKFKSQLKDPFYYIDFINKLLFKFVHNFDDILERDISDSVFMRNLKNDFSKVLNSFKNENRLISFFLFFDKNKIYINEVYTSNLDDELKKVANLMDYNLVVYAGNFVVDNNILICVFYLNDLEQLINKNVNKNIDKMEFIKKAQDFWAKYGLRLLELYNLSNSFGYCVKEIELRYNKNSGFKSVVLKAVNRAKLFFI